MFRDLIKHGSVMTVGNVLAGLLSYAFLAIAARELGPASFGALGALLSVYYVAASLISTLITVVSRNVADLRSREPGADITHLVRSPLIAVGVYSAIVLIIYVAASPVTSRLLKIENVPAVVLMGALCVVAALNGILRGALQGVRRFAAVAAVIACESLLRLLSGIGFSLIGFTLVGALLAYLSSTTLCFLFTLPLVPLDWPKLLSPVIGKPDLRITGKAVSTALAFALFAGITQLDMLAAKVYLSASDAGHYAAACNFVKIPFLLVAESFAMAMFPTLVAVRSGTRDGRRLLRATVLVLGGGVGGVALTCVWLAEPIISLLLGPEFLAMAPWLGIFALAVCAPAVLSVGIRYALLSDARLLGWALAAGLAANAVSLTLFHRTPMQLSAGLLAGGTVPLVLLVVSTLRSRRAS